MIIEEHNLIKGNKPEEEFQKIIKALIDNILKQESRIIDYFILESFGFNLAIFLRSHNNYFVKFIELKAFISSRQIGVGFGNSKGKSSQVDLPLLDKQHLGIANNLIRWILINGFMEKGSKGYVLFDNLQAKNSAMNIVARSKQNNFNINKLMKFGITWENLIKELKNFLLKI